MPRLLRTTLIICAAVAALYVSFVTTMTWMIDSFFVPDRWVRPVSLLSELNLEDGHYLLVIDNGERDGPQPQGGIVRFIDDQEAIARYRDEVNIKWSFTEYLPGEGRGDYYIYVYRDGERVAGRSVPSAFQVEAPQALLERGRPMRHRIIREPLEAYRATLATIKMRSDVLIRDAETPENHGDYQHSFFVDFATIAVPADSDFDYSVYASNLAARIAKDVPGHDLLITTSSAPNPETSIRRIMSEAGEYLRDANGEVRTLPGVAFYEVRLHVKGTPETYALFEKFDLNAYVADMRNTDLIVRAWQQATGSDRVSQNIHLDEYDNTSGLSDLHEKTYMLRYWEPVADQAMGDTIKAFHNAVHMSDTGAVATMLRDNPAFATTRDNFGFQPVHLLDMYFEERILNHLLESGADINARNDEGITRLHIIAEPDAVPVIVEAGGDIEAADARGRTPILAQASEPNRADIVEALIAAGANLDARDHDGHAALSIARMRQDDELIVVLTRAGAQ